MQLCLSCLAAPLKLAATDTCGTRLHSHSVVRLTKEAADDEEEDEETEKQAEKQAVTQAEEEEEEDEKVEAGT